MALKALVQQSVTEIDGKRLKMRKAAFANLNMIRVKTSQVAGPEYLHKILISMASLTEEKAASIIKQVEDSLSEGRKGPSTLDKSKDFRSFLKQQKQMQSQSTSEQQLL